MAAKPVFYTPAEAAEILRVGNKTLQTWRRDGRGPAFIKDGNVVLYPEAAIVAWMQQKLTRAGAA